MSPEPSTSTAPERQHLTLDVLPADFQWPSASSSTAYSAFRPLRAIDSTVTFRSSTAVTGESRCQVFKNNELVYTETTNLHLHMSSSSCMPGSTFSTDMQVQLMYSTRLVPQYWSTLCNAAGMFLHNHCAVDS